MTPATKARTTVLPGSRHHKHTMTHSGSSIVPTGVLDPASGVDPTFDATRLRRDSRAGVGRVGAPAADTRIIFGIRSPSVGPRVTAFPPRCIGRRSATLPLMGQDCYARVEAAIGPNWTIAHLDTGSARALVDMSPDRADRLKIVRRVRGRELCTKKKTQLDRSIAKNPTTTSPRQRS
jgi:hypothetical protein